MGNAIACGNHSCPAISLSVSCGFGGCFVCGETCAEHDNVNYRYEETNCKLSRFHSAESGVFTLRFRSCTLGLSR